MGYGHTHYHEHGGGGVGAVLVFIAFIGFLFLTAISAFITILAPLTGLFLWVCLIGYPVFAYICSSSIAEAVRRTLLAWCWYMLSAVVAGVPLLFLGGLLLETNPTQEANVLSVAVCIVGIIGMGIYTLSWFRDR